MGGNDRNETVGKPLPSPGDAGEARNRPGLLAHGGGWAHFSWLTWLARRRRPRARAQRNALCAPRGWAWRWARLCVAMGADAAMRRGPALILTCFRGCVLACAHHVTVAVARCAVVLGAGRPRSNVVQDNVVRSLKAIVPEAAASAHVSDLQHT